MTKPKTIADLKPSPTNPRKISLEELAGLQASVNEFGDISGLVFNTRTGNLVCGHQRLEALKQSTSKLTLERNGDGTTVVTDDGRRFPVRLVEWDKDKEKLANVAANNPHIAGEWTDGLGVILDDLQASLPDLTEALRLEPLRVGVSSLSGDNGTPADVGIPDEYDHFELVIEFKNEQDQRTAFEKLTGEGYTCRALTY